MPPYGARCCAHTVFAGVLVVQLDMLVNTVSSQRAIQDGLMDRVDAVCVRLYLLPKLATKPVAVKAIALAVSIR